jgi:hypothetical protein
MNRAEILATASKLTTGDRNKSYGEPYLNMLNFACLIEGYLQARGVEIDVTAEDAAWIMVLAKMARTVNPSTPHHPDNYIDAAAYAAIAGECSGQERD